MVDDEEDYLFFGRREFPHSVTWAGEPAKTESGAGAGGSALLAPRTSFPAWEEEVRGRSRPYPDHEREVLGTILQALRASFSA